MAEKKIKARHKYMPPQKSLDNLKKGRTWKKGESGNPNGRPKGSGTISRYLAQILEAQGKPIINPISGKKEGVSGSQALAFRMFELALAGDYRFMREILDRTEGVISQGNAADTLSIDDLKSQYENKYIVEIFDTDKDKDIQKIEHEVIDVIPIDEEEEPKYIEDGTDNKTRNKS